MKNKNEFPVWEDILCCFLIIILFCVKYSTLITDTGGDTRGQSLIQMFIILDKYLGEVGIYIFLGILFLWFLISAIRKILKRNSDD